MGSISLLCHSCSEASVITMTSQGLGSGNILRLNNHMPYIVLCFQHGEEEVMILPAFDFVDKLAWDLTRPGDLTPVVFWCCEDVFLYPSLDTYEAELAQVSFADFFWQ